MRVLSKCKICDSELTYIAAYSWCNICHQYYRGLHTQDIYC